MVKLHEAVSEVMKDEDGSSYQEKAYIFAYSSGREAEDFELLTHDEQIKACKLEKEEEIKSFSHGTTVHRYTVDAGDFYVFVREVVYIF